MATVGRSSHVQSAEYIACQSYYDFQQCLLIVRFVCFNNNNNNNNNYDKRLGLAAKADQPDHKKYNTAKIKIDNEAVQKLHTS